MFTLTEKIVNNNIIFNSKEVVSKITHALKARIFSRHSHSNALQLNAEKLHHGSLSVPKQHAAMSGLPKHWMQNNKLETITG